jgi:hypothetical protein
VWRRIVTGVLVLGIAAGTVAAILFLPDKDGSGTGANVTACSDFRTAKVFVEVRVAAGDLDYPRLHAQIRVQIPLATSGMEAMLSRPSDDESYRDLMACVLDPERPENEVRDDDPQVSIANGMVEIVHTGHTDVVRAGESRTNLVAAEVAEVRLSDSPWQIRVFPTPALRDATWNVTISAPDGWLSRPSPIQSAKLQPTEIQWRDIRVVEDSVAAARVEPDTTNSITVGASSRRWLPVVWGLSWFSAFVLIYYAWRRRKLADPLAEGFERERRTARRALWALVVVLPITASLAVLSANFDYANDLMTSLTFAAYVDVGLALVTAFVAWVWWLPRVLAVLGGLFATAGLVSARVLGGDVALSKPERLSPPVQALQLGSVFVVTLLLIMAVAKAFEVLLLPGRRRRSTSRWHWLLGSFGAAVLMAEETVLPLVNQARQEWLGFTPTVNLMHKYQYYLWDLFDEATWLLMLVAAAAVWHQYARTQFETQSKVARRGAVVLFVVGPMWLEIWFRSIAVPIWLVIAPIVVIIGWLFVSLGLWRPVLARLSNVPTLEEARTAAQAWYADKQQRKSVPTPVDVLLALGPGGAPRDNLHKSVQFVGVPALIGGVLLCVAEWLTYPIVSINQSDSVVLELLDNVGWEAAKWVLAAAALGLAWQHLPGRRGMIKALPLVVVYATGPLLQWGLTLLTDGAPDWLPLADAALFAVVLLIVGLRMDRAALIDVAPEGGSRFRTLINAYGLENLSARLTALLTPVLVVLAVVSAFQSGDVSFPNVDPSQLSRK